MSSLNVLNANFNYTSCGSTSTNRVVNSVKTGRDKIRDSKMKYHTLSTSSLSTEGKKSTLTIYADMDFKNDKLEAELLAARRELEGVQNALRHQTQRCRELVTEFSRKLQSKELEIHSERQLRDQQLTKVLRALLLFEARLVKEQKLIRQQLKDKDMTIYFQQIQIRKLQLLNNEACCKNCQSSNLESLDSNSEIFENGVENLGKHCDSGSEIYAISEKDFKRMSSEGAIGENRITYIKNKQNLKANDSAKRVKKYPTSRRSAGTYFEILRRRESCPDSSSNDEGSDPINDPRTTEHQITKVSQRIESIFSENTETILSSKNFSDRIDSLHGIKKVSDNEKGGSLSDELYTSSSISASSSSATSTNYCSTADIRGSYEPNGTFNCYSSTKSESEVTYVESTKKDEGDNLSIEVFELADDVGDDNDFTGISPRKNSFIFDKNEVETNENWYASASDQEDDQKCDMYRNNPVLECMNQILLQNINDSINSPPKSPINTLSKSKSAKRVKFSDESDEAKPIEEQPQEKAFPENSDSNNYYETPIQNVANVYEVPQSIYSNDYEQIMIDRNDSIQNNWLKTHPPKPENLQEKEVSRMASQKLSVPKKNCELDNLNDSNKYYYVDVDSKLSSNLTIQSKLRKSKLSRIPPALPPKPANLLSKYKINGKPLTVENVNHISKTIDISQNEPEPDYCSISELNMAAIETVSLPKVAQVVENLQNLANVSTIYDQIIGNTPPKHSLNSKAVKRETVTSPNKSPTKKSPEIPKLPQVSEIIIPSESDNDSSSKDDAIRINQDNYIKNNSQLLKQKSPKVNGKIPIKIGTSVSSLITGFNNQIILSEISNPSIKSKNNNNNCTNVNNNKSVSPQVFTNFDTNQNFDKYRGGNVSEAEKISKSETPPSFEKFDLSQNFEEFNLDDCEICEEYHIDMDDSRNKSNQSDESQSQKSDPDEKSPTPSFAPKSEQSISSSSLSSLSSASLSNSTSNLLQPNFSLAAMKSNSIYGQQPNYEQFLECTGLSSKSILTPTRLISNHKSMLKPKDVKLRDKVRSSATFDRQQTNTIKYYSEPYL